MSDGLFHTGISALAPEAQKEWIKRAADELATENARLRAEMKRWRNLVREAESLIGPARTLGQEDFYEHVRAAREAE